MKKALVFRDICHTSDCNGTWSRASDYLSIWEDMKAPFWDTQSLQKGKNKGISSAYKGENKAKQEMWSTQQLRICIA